MNADTLQTLHDWHSARVDVGPLLPVLSTYLGHVQFGLHVLVAQLVYLGVTIAAGRRRPPAPLT